MNFKKIVILAMVVWAAGCSAQRKDVNSDGTAKTTTDLNQNDLAVAADTYGYPHSKLWGVKHVEYVSKHSESIRGTKKDCTSCHEHKKRDVAPVKANCTMTCHMPSDSEAGDPTRPPSHKAPGAFNSCLECHQKHVSQEFLHWPAGEGDCTACHTVNPAHAQDTKNKNLVTTRDPKESCVSCHGPLTLKSQVHKAVHDEKSCVNCHDAHGSARRFFLKDSNKPLCLSCHGKNSETPIDADAPVGHMLMSSEKSCLHCHENHSSDNKPLLKKRSDELCLSCHNRERRVQHGKDLDVIDNIAEAIKPGNNIHAPVDVEESCVSCHNPHGSENPRMLTLNYEPNFHNAYNPGDKGPNSYALCLDCHNKDNLLSKELKGLKKATKFRNDVKDAAGNVTSKNLHWFHVVDNAGRDDKKWGISCYACHDPHGSSQEKLIKTKVRMVRQDSPYRLTMKYEKTESGGNCTKSCHKSHPYQYIEK